MGIPNLLLEFEKFRHTREGFVGIIFASQLIGERPTKWNTPYPLGQFGRDLLEAIYANQFQVGLSLDGAQVYWEFELSLQNAEGSRWPDLAVRTEQRIILFELKTETGSIREGQVDEQLLLGRHHFPGMTVDMLYITADPIDGEPPPDARSRYCNLTWAAIAALERGLPQPSVAGEGAILAMFCDYLDGLRGITNRRKTGVKYKSKEVSMEASKAQSALPDGGPIVDEQGQVDFEAILHIFRVVESTGQQAALELPCQSPNDAHSLIDQIESRIKTSNQSDATPILHARGWVWTPASKGKAMTQSGRIHDVEVRVSRHQKAQRA